MRLALDDWVHPTTKMSSCRDLLVRVGFIQAIVYDDRRRGDSLLLHVHTLP